MTEALTLKAELLAIYRNMVRAITDSAPQVIAGFLAVFLGFLVIKLLEVALRGILSNTRVDRAMERVGVSAMLEKARITTPTSRLVPRLVFYLLLFLLVQTVADSLGLTPISRAIGSVFAYLPNLASALILVVVGVVAARFAGDVVMQAADDADLEFARALGRLASTVVLFVAGVIAASQLEIDTTMVRIGAGCVLIGLAFAFGLSFGLGTRDITRNIVAGFYARKIFQVGEEIEMGGERGILTEIMPVQTVLEVDKRTVTVSNSAFIEGVVRQ